MRARLGALVALVFLASCSVPTDGGKCTSDANCPSGQRCGYGSTCSTAAAACTGAICQQGDTTCNSDGSSVLTCVPDANGVCSTMPTTGGTACGDARTCVVGACQPMYQVAITAPAAGAYLGTSGVMVTVSVTRATSNVTVADVSLVPSDGAAVAVPKTSENQLTATYQVTFSPGAVSDGPITLTAVARPGSANETPSSPVSVIVDQTPPAISNVSFSCGTCLRDAVLTVSATVTDMHLDASPGGVVAVIDFGTPFSPVQIPLSGMPPNFSGTLDLGSVPFPFLYKDGRATVGARDLAQNTSSLPSASKTVTRIRWSIPVETASPPTLTGPAVEDGSLFLGGGNGKVYKVNPLSGAIARWPVTSGAAIAAAPSVGTTGLWVSGQDSKVYVLDKVSGTVLNTTCPTVGATQTTAALGMNGSMEVGYVVSWNGSATQAGLYAVREAGCLQSLYSSSQIPAAPAVDSSGNVYAAIGTNLRSFHVVSSPTPAFVENWSTTVGAASAPLAIDATPLVYTAATDGSLKKTTTVGTSTSAGTAGTFPDAPVLDAAGNVIVGDGSGVLHKLSPSGTALWATPPSLGAATSSALVLSGGDAAYVVPTATGTVAAVKADGTVLWTGQVTAATGTALREPNILKLSGEAFSTAVFGATDGSVYGVIVDGDLDTSSPWPKTHHDPRNTGNAATPLP